MAQRPVTGERDDTPAPEQFQLGAVFAALADHHRRHIVRELLKEPPGTRRKCSSFGIRLAKSTMTHHFRVLRESGLVMQFDFGNRAELMLRREEVESRFPGLLGLVATHGT